MSFIKRRAIKVSGLRSRTERALPGSPTACLASWRKKGIQRARDCFFSLNSSIRNNSVIFGVFYSSMVCSLFLFVNIIDEYIGVGLTVASAFRWPKGLLYSRLGSSNVQAFVPGVHKDDGVVPLKLQRDRLD